uniref:ADAM metallopeptidase domain 28 n=1 Tax=Sparus aurata TaxID=8175 RepID=A0A671W5N3_SPAAU
AMTLGGRDIEMQLEKNNSLNGLFSQTICSYFQLEYKLDSFHMSFSDSVTCSCLPQDHCYYHGRIVNDSGSAVSISTCDGLRGYFRTSAQRYLIEPLTGGDEGDHAVMTFNDTKDTNSTTPAVCGVTNTSWSDEIEPPTGRSRSRSAVKLSSHPAHFYVLRKKYWCFICFILFRPAGNLYRPAAEIHRMTRFVSLQAYKPLRTFVALVGLEIWSNSDQITVTPPAGANLDAFMKWRNSVLVKRTKHDNAHLISGIDFEGATVGLAFIGTLCSGHSVGVVQDHNDRSIAVGATLAHEMGHNLGMDHDDSSRCACSGDSCIMAAALSWNVPRTFSSCSAANYEKYLTGRNPSCLLDKPDFRGLKAPSVCGNGFLENGEQCDCGSVEECTNPCCNATTCTLTAGAECGEGDCCDNCKISSRSKECRGAQDECDLAEYCDGKNTDCPEDVFAVNGLQCDGGRGYCHNGQCPQRPNQCVKMYGPGATEARRYCYEQNTRGTYYAFCKRPSNSLWIPCQAADIYCGKLFCHNGNENPNYGRMVRFSDCKASFYDDYTKDYGQVDTGTKCGDGKVTLAL